MRFVCRVVGWGLVGGVLVRLFVRWFAFGSVSVVFK